MKPRLLPRYCPLVFDRGTNMCWDSQGVIWCGLPHVIDGEKLESREGGESLRRGEVSLWYLGEIQGGEEGGEGKRGGGAKRKLIVGGVGGVLLVKATRERWCVGETTEWMETLVCCWNVVTWRLVGRLWRVKVQSGF